LCSCCSVDNLVLDDREKCDKAVERGSLDKLADVVKAVTKVDEGENEWEDGEPESISLLREVRHFVLVFISRIFTYVLPKNSNRPP
jgi:hypothetical protein